MPCTVEGTAEARVGWWLLRVAEQPGRCWFGGQFRRVAAEAVLHAEGTNT